MLAGRGKNGDANPSRTGNGGEQTVVYEIMYLAAGRIDVALEEMVEGTSEEFYKGHHVLHQESRIWFYRSGIWKSGNGSNW